MSTYALTGTGVQALSAGVVALHVTITTTPASAGNGRANPLDYYGVGLLRPGDAVAFWEAFPICGGPQWLPLPYGTTQLGYALLDGAAVSVAEVTAPAPLAFPLASLPDVAIGTPSDAQVLAWQASTSRWINATPAGGSGGSGAGTLVLDYVATADLLNGTTMTVGTWLDIVAAQSFTVPTGSTKCLISIGGNVDIGSSSGASQSGSRLVLDATTNVQLGGAWHAQGAFGNALAGAGPKVVALSPGAHTLKAQVVIRGGTAGRQAFCQPATNPTTDAFWMQVLAL